MSFDIAEIKGRGAMLAINAQIRKELATLHNCAFGLRADVDHYDPECAAHLRRPELYKARKTMERINELLAEADALGEALHLRV